MSYLHLCDLATLAIGVALMLASPYMMPAPDWDIPISLFMAGFAPAFAASFCMISYGFGPLRSKSRPC